MVPQDGRSAQGTTSHGKFRLTHLLIRYVSCGLIPISIPCVWQHHRLALVSRAAKSTAVLLAWQCNDHAVEQHLVRHVGPPSSSSAQAVEARLVERTFIVISLVANLENDAYHIRVVPMPSLDMPLELWLEDHDQSL